MKICHRCKQTKSISEFCKSKTRKDGRQKVCKICEKQYRQKNAEHITKRLKQYYQKNIERLLKQKKQYYQKNADKRLEYNKQYYKKNAKKLCDQNTQYQRARLKSDALYKFKHRVRCLLNGSFKRNGTKNYKKQSKTETLLGCTIPEFRDHLEKQFQPGMSFENHGEWHIDHRIPLASAKSQSEIEKLCHYTNLQPLWAKDNLSKGGNINST